MKKRKRSRELKRKRRERKRLEGRRIKEESDETG
jgi:hypothetical protein